MSVFITGSYPPDVCGVGDYTKCILETEYAKSHQWSLYYSKTWNLSSFFCKLHDIKKLAGVRDIYVEYPTEGYKNSILPHLLAVMFSLFYKNRTIMVFHECNMRTFKAKCILYFTLLLTNKIIFTNEYHRNYFCSKIKSLKKRSKVVKIFSNIPRVGDIKNICNRTYDVAIFGHIRKSKGIDEFVDAIAEIRKRGYDFKTIIFGQVPKGHESYFDYVKDRCNKLGISLECNLSEEEVAEKLNDCKLMVYVFHDGLSEKRGSFLASASNGTLICSTEGVYTTDKMKDSFFVVDKECIVESIINILTSSESDLQYWQQKVLDYVNSEMPNSWNAVAYEYTKW